VNFVSLFAGIGVVRSQAGQRAERTLGWLLRHGARRSHDHGGFSAGKGFGDTVFRGRCLSACGCLRVDGYYHWRSACGF
jgi:hypothetical protein